MSDRRLARHAPPVTRRSVTRVLVVRGEFVTPWELRPWLQLPTEYEVRVLLTRSNHFDAPAEMRFVDVRSFRDLLPRGRFGELAASLIGNRYLSADEAFEWADIVHSEELSFWFAADAARRRPGAHFRLVQTVWETLPMLATYRNRRPRRHRELVLAHSDRFLPTTERAALALALEGVDPARIEVCPPGIDIDRFTPSDSPDEPEAEHVIVSPGRLVWEKGHQDVLRALALLHRGVVVARDGRPLRPRLQIIGAGPEQARLGAYAQELGLESSVEIGAVAYDEMPGRFAGASAMVLASQASSTTYRPFDIPRAFWEEQFGMVLAEAMAAGLSIVTTTSGAIPEVVAGTEAQLVAPGDWVGLAHALARGPLSRPPGARVAYPAQVVERYSTTAAAQRLAGAYARVLGNA
jgi:glycosyltransferase involved in cell wall biosynthesis